ncbi:hypothetical protein AB0M43_39025 [Longispora sp. NPDC051575]|uniref:hypothetical protein n=1 Tax=Longispora sp. NPDC051575 TaxID=3154943 RepID=UPI003422C798
MYRHETGRAAITDPVYRQLYCLAYDASPHDLFGAFEAVEDSRDHFVVRSHKFIPTFVGAEAVAHLISNLEMAPQVEQWTDCRSTSVTHPGGPCDLYVWPFGVAVYHLVEELEFPSLAALSVWRQASYRDNMLWTCDDLEAHLGTVHPASYILGAYWMVKPLWSGGLLDTALRILCTPKVLLRRNSNGEGTLGHAELVERSLLSEGYEHGEIVDFGIKGVSSGYASWSGVVYYPTAPDRALTENEFVACELATQSLWAYCEYINSQVESGRDPVVPGEYSWRFLRGMRSRMTTPRARESGQHRSLRNAVLQTSDLVPHLAQAIETLRELNEG